MTTTFPPIPMDVAPRVESFFDDASNTITHLVRDPASDACAIVDPVLGFDAAAGRTTTGAADALIAHIQDAGLHVSWIIETHVHADHLSDAPYLQERLGGKIGIGARVVQVQDEFGKIFNEGTAFERDGSQFDQLFTDGDTYHVGSLACFAFDTPGHTPACMTHVMGAAAFVGDTLFMPDGGTARADFPGGDARQLYRSIQRVLSLPPTTTLYMCHDYGPGGRAIGWTSTVAEQRDTNIHVGNGTTEDEFVALRTARDATLSMPKLMLPSVQVNMRSGQMPPPEDEGGQFIKIPINRL